MPEPTVTAEDRGAEPPIWFSPLFCFCIFLLFMAGVYAVRSFSATGIDQTIYGNACFIRLILLWVIWTNNWRTPPKEFSASGQNASET